MEIWFVDGLFKGQVWILKNLEMKDLLYHYEHLPMAYVRETIIYVRTEKKRVFLNDFFELYYSNRKKESKTIN
jgi:hypothetical protein